MSDVVKQLRDMLEPGQRGCQCRLCRLFGGAADEIERLREECNGWQKLANDAERAIGMNGVATTPEARSLGEFGVVEWCDEAKHTIERLQAERNEAREAAQWLGGKALEACGRWPWLEELVGDGDTDSPE